MAIDVQAIIEDGTVDAQEAAELRADIFDDGAVDRDEANALFEINDNTDNNCPQFVTLFVEAISAHVLEDGVIDQEETNWLVNKIQGDGQVCGAELALLNAMATTVTLPPELAALNA